MNRWKIVAGSLLIQLSNGGLYAWSVFTPYLTGQTPDGFTQFHFTSTETQVIFSTALATFALVMIFAGHLQVSIGPRLVSIAGGLILASGYILAGLYGTSFFMQLLTIGILGGAGIGLTYGCPIAVGMHWFPDKKGTITGIVIAGFGFGAMIWVKVAGSWGHLIDNYGVLKVFCLFGIIYGIMILVGSLFMVNPPAGWALPSSTKKAHPAQSNTQPARDYPSNEMLRTHQFYILWIAFIFSTMAGLMVIGTIKLFGIDALQKAGYDSIQASATAGTAMAVFYAFGNGSGRIIWGIISEFVRRKYAIAILTSVQGITMLLFYYMGSNPLFLYLGAAFIGFNFGGNFALFPVITSDYFGIRYIASNYSWMFTAYGVGGIFGPIIAGFIRDIWQNFHGAFTIAGCSCLLATLLTLLSRKPERRE